jgi:hypothetical protein
MTSANHTDIVKAIEDAGYICKLWERDAQSRLYVQFDQRDRKGMGYIDLNSGIYHSQSNSGHRLNTTLIELGLVKRA